MPNPPFLRMVLPRFSNTYLVWRDPEPYVGDITGVQILYLIDCIPQNIPELGGGVNHYSVSGIKNSTGKRHSVSLRAKTSAGWGQYSTPIQFIFRPIGKAVDMQLLFIRVPCVCVVPQYGLACILLLIKQAMQAGSSAKASRPLNVIYLMQLRLKCLLGVRH